MAETEQTDNERDDNYKKLNQKTKWNNNYRQLNRKEKKIRKRMKNTNERECNEQTDKRKDNTKKIMGDTHKRKG